VPYKTGQGLKKIRLPIPRGKPLLKKNLFEKMIFRNCVEVGYSTVKKRSAENTAVKLLLSAKIISPEPKI
jgi:hypothetical protein